MSIRKKPGAVGEPVGNCPIHLLAFEGLGLEEGLNPAGFNELNVYPRHVGVRQVLAIGRNRPSLHWVLTGICRELPKLQVYNSCWRALRKPCDGGEQEKSSDSSSKDRTAVKESRLYPGLAGLPAQAFRYSLQVGVDLRGGLITQLAILLERFDDDRVQPRRNFRIQLPQRDRRDMQDCIVEYRGRLASECLPP